MSRSSWSIYVMESDGSYTSDGTIYRPNEDLDVGLISNHTKVKLADGTNAFVTLETEYEKEQLTFMWHEITTADGLIAQLEGYINSGDVVKITNHLSTDYIGRFVNITKTHLIGQTDTWDVSAMFDQL